MKNKILIELIVPQIDQKFNLYIPINKKIGNIIVLLNKAVSDITNGVYVGSNKSFLYNRQTGARYDINQIVLNTDIRNGTSIVLI